MSRPVVCVVHHRAVGDVNESEEMKVVWRSKRERHERKNTVTAVVVVVIVIAWTCHKVWAWIGGLL